jgi:hypothetical protein
LYVFDSEAFYKALAAVVVARSVSWRRVGLDCGIDSSTFYRMSRGRGINGDTLAAVAAWAGLNTNDFVRKVGLPSREPRPHEHRQSPIEHEQSRGNHQESGTLNAICNLLRADPQLSTRAAQALQNIVEAAYNGLKIM